MSVIFCKSFFIDGNFEFRLLFYFLFLNIHEVSDNNNQLKNLICIHFLVRVASVL